MSDQDHEISEDEIFVHRVVLCAEESIAPESKCDEAGCVDYVPPGDSGASDEPEDAPKSDRPDQEKLHEGAAAPWGYTKSGKPRKRPLKTPSEETLKKRRSALEKGRAARAEKILERKRRVIQFFGEDCLKNNTLKALESAMATAKESLKSTQKKVWAKPSRTTLPSERVVGRAPPKQPPRSGSREESAEITPSETPKKTPEVPPKETPTKIFRPVSATPPPMIWKPKAKKKLY